MEAAKTLNHSFATFGWGALLIWWGVVIMIDPLTIGIGAAGTGLILLGVNATRLLKGIPTRASTTTAGIIALVWGSLDHFLSLSFGPSLAILLILIGVAEIVSLLARPRPV
jgi:hypothetical protein